MTQRELPYWLAVTSWHLPESRDHYRNNWLIRKKWRRWRRQSKVVRSHIKTKNPINPQRIRRNFEEALTTLSNSNELTRPESASNISKNPQQSLRILLWICPLICISFACRENKHVTVSFSRLFFTNLSCTFIVTFITIVEDFGVLNIVNVKWTPWNETSWNCIDGARVKKVSFKLSLYWR